MIDVLFFSRTIYNILRFKPVWKSFVNQLMLNQSLNNTQLPQEFYSLSRAAKGEIGGINYDLTNSKFGRQEAQIISAEAQTIATKADNIIDEKIKCPQEREDVIKNLLDMIKTGAQNKNTNIHVKGLYVICKDLYNRISRSPYKHRFFNEYENLADAAIEQVRGNNSIDTSYRIGAGIMAISAVIPYCYNNQISERFLTAAKHFGGYFDILDEIEDIREDKAHGITTSLTETNDLNHNKNYLRKIAKEHYEECLSNLQPREKSIYKTFGLMLYTYWASEKIRGN